MVHHRIPFSPNTVRVILSLLFNIFLADKDIFWVIFEWQKLHFFSSQMDSLPRIIQTCHGMSYRLNRHIFILDFNKGNIDLGMHFKLKFSTLFKSSTYVLEHVLLNLNVLGDYQTCTSGFNRLDRWPWLWNWVMSHDVDERPWRSFEQKHVYNINYIQTVFVLVGKHMNPHHEWNRIDKVNSEFMHQT